MRALGPELNRDKSSWFLGYLVPEGEFIPDDDPVQTQATLWRDLEDYRWW